MTIPGIQTFTHPPIHTYTYICIRSLIFEVLLLVPYPNQRTFFIILARPRAVTGHSYIFGGFPQLSGRNEGFRLDEDIMREIDEVLIEPDRILIKAIVGKGIQ